MPRIHNLYTKSSLESIAFLSYCLRLVKVEGKNCMKISSLERIYILKDIVVGQAIELNQDQTHYLTSVMRCKIGWKLRIFNERSGEFIAKISFISKKSCALEVLELFRAPNQMPYLCLAQCIIKPDRMMTAIAMATQLGATDIKPIITERTQSKTINNERSMRVLLENTEQCERFLIPKLHEVQTLRELVEGGDFDRLIYANENEADVPSGLTRRSHELREILGSAPEENKSATHEILGSAPEENKSATHEILGSAPEENKSATHEILGSAPEENKSATHEILGSAPEENKITILIGPEGGFTDAELDYLSRCPNAYSVSLGPTVLRSETAAVALASLVQILR